MLKDNNAKQQQPLQADKQLFLDKFPSGFSMNQSTVHFNEIFKFKHHESPLTSLASSQLGPKQMNQQSQQHQKCQMNPIPMNQADGLSSIQDNDTAKPQPVINEKQRQLQSSMLFQKDIKLQENNNVVHQISQDDQFLIELMPSGISIRNNQDIRSMIKSVIQVGELSKKEQSLGQSLIPNIKEKNSYLEDRSPNNSRKLSLRNIQDAEIQTDQSHIIQDRLRKQQTSNSSNQRNELRNTLMNQKTIKDQVCMDVIDENQDSSMQSEESGRGDQYQNDNIMISTQLNGMKVGQKEEVIFNSVQKQSNQLQKSQQSKEPEGITPKVFLKQSGTCKYEFKASHFNHTGGFSDCLPDSKLSKSRGGHINAVQQRVLLDPVRFDEQNRNNTGESIHLYDYSPRQDKNAAKNSPNNLQLDQIIEEEKICSEEILVNAIPNTEMIIDFKKQSTQSKQHPSYQTLTKLQEKNLPLEDFVSNQFHSNNNQIAEMNTEQQTPIQIDEIKMDNLGIEAIQETEKSGASGMDQMFKPVTQHQRLKKLAELKRGIQKKIEYDRESLYIFNRKLEWRLKLIDLVDSKNFDNAMICFIIMNSLILAFYDYSDRESLSINNRIIDNINIALTIIFVIEALMKVIAYGLILHKNAYLRSGWNIIDCLVVISGVLEFSISTINLKALRGMRIMRPLKTIRVLPVFAFLLFATIGLHQYNGQFYNACRVNSVPDDDGFWEADISIMRLCSENGLGNYQCPNGLICGNPDIYPDLQISSLENMQLRPYVNYGITNFNHIGSSLLSVFQIITSETWYQQLCNLMDVDIPLFALIYCFLMIIVGQLFLLNLFLAVIVHAFIKSSKDDIQFEIKDLKDENDKIENERKAVALNKSFVPMIIDQGSGGTFIVRDSGKDLQDTMVLGKISNMKTVNEPTHQTLNGVFSQRKQMTKKDSKKKFSHQATSLSQKNPEGLQKSSTLSALTFLKPQAKQRMVIDAFHAHSPYRKKTTVNSVKNASNSQIIMKPLSLNAIAGGSFKSLNNSSNNQPEIEQHSSNDLILNTPDLVKEKQRTFWPQHASEPISILKDMKKVGLDTVEHTIGTGLQQPIVSLNRIDEEVSEQNDDEGSDIAPKINSQINHEVQGIHKQRSVKEEEKYSNPPSIIIEQIHDQLAEISARKYEHATPEQRQAQIRMKLMTEMQKKIERQYDQYFRKIVEEARENVTSVQDTMRELVAIKVGLVYIREQQLIIKQDQVDQKLIEERLQRNKIYDIAFKIAESFTFGWIIALIIATNTIILTFDEYPSKYDLNDIFEMINIIFSLIFTLELGVKLIAFGFKSFFKGSWLNFFDAIIVFASLIDILMANTVQKDEQQSGSMLTVLRGFRLLRVFKLAKKWRRFDLLLETLGKSLKDIATFTVFLLLFIFVFTLLGMELFAHKAKIDLLTNVIDFKHGRSPNFNFDNFMNSFTLVFIILTNDGASPAYYNYYRTVGPFQSTVFFVLLIVVGQKVIINLFVASLLENFDEGALLLKLHLYEEQEFRKFKQYELKKLTTNDRRMYQSMTSKIREKCWRVIYCIQRYFEGSNNLQFPDSSINEQKSGSGINQDDEPEEDKIQGWSLFLMREDNKFRRFLDKFVNHKVFEIIILIAILASGVQLALNGPLQDPNSNLAAFLNVLDLVITFIFIIEAFLKILIYGFLFNGKFSYLRQGWFQMDFVILILSVLSLTPLSDHLKTFKALRMLRLIGRQEGLIIAVRALMGAVANIINVSMIMFLFFLIFGVIFVSQFKGTFFECHGQISVLKMAVHSKWDCINSGGYWINSVQNFDNVPTAMNTLFAMASTIGWRHILFKSITSTDIDYIAENDINYFWSLVFIFFMIMAQFFFLKLFIGVVVVTFNSEKDKIGGNNLLTEKQRDWITQKLLVLKCAPIRKIQPPESTFRKFFFSIHQNPNFEKIIFGIIILNSIALTLKWYEQSTYYSTAFELVNYIFTGVFILEAFIKLVGLGWNTYFRDNWNRFDFLTVVFSILSMIITVYSQLEIKGVITPFRSFRVLRILRLLKRGGRTLYLIFNTLVLTMQQLVNIGALLILIIYMYSVLGIILFGNVKRNGMMNDYINFESFPNAFITLFVAMTSDSWSYMQSSFIVENTPHTPCLINPTYDDYIANNRQTLGCNSKIASYCFFTSYMFIINMIFLQLFIAVILKGYDETQIEEAKMFNNDMTVRFREEWAEYDPEATTFISLDKLRHFLKSLGAPLGFDKFCKGRSFQDKFISHLEIPTYNDFTQYHFLDVLDSLSFRLMVLEHLQKKYMEDLGTVPAPGQEPSNEVELRIKNELTVEVNRLRYQRKLLRTMAVQEVLKKEQQRQGNEESNGLNSSHQMAAEATIRKMKEFIMKMRQVRHREYLISKLRKNNNPITIGIQTDPISEEEGESEYGLERDIEIEVKHQQRPPRHPKKIPVELTQSEQHLIQQQRARRKKLAQILEDDDEDRMHNHHHHRHSQNHRKTLQTETNFLDPIHFKGAHSKQNSSKNHKNEFSSRKVSVKEQSKRKQSDQHESVLNSERDFVKSSGNSYYDDYTGSMQSKRQYHEED